MRIGVVSYVNALPLAHGLETHLPGAAIIRTSPSEIADELNAGNLDVGLVPVAALADHPQWARVPGMGIASHGPVRSVSFLADRQPEAVTAWTLDPASRTSNVLARLWLGRVTGRDLPGTPGAATCEARFRESGATVCIGDDALFGDDPAPVRVDLGEAWTEWTGLPFVYAVWAGPGAGSPDLHRALHACYGENAERLEELAHWESPHDERRRTLITSYLRWNIRYRLGDEEERGLSRFLGMAVEAGILTGSRMRSHVRR